MIIYIIYLNATGSKLGCYIPLPLQKLRPQCFTTLNKNALLVLPSAIRRIEQKWMWQSHGILQLPRSFFRTLVLPLHLYLSYGSVPEHCDLLVEDAHWLSSELSLGFHLNHIPIYHMVRIMNTTKSFFRSTTFNTSALVRRFFNRWKLSSHLDVHSNFIPFFCKEVMACATLENPSMNLL